MSESKDSNNEKNRDYLSPYPVSRLSPAFDLVDLAKEIARADDMLSVQTNGKLKLLAGQIRELQEEAKRITLRELENLAFEATRSQFYKDDKFNPVKFVNFIVGNTVQDSAKAFAWSIDVLLDDSGNARHLGQ